MTQTHVFDGNAVSACGGHLVSVDGVHLPLCSTRLVVRSAAGLAAVKVVQTFVNPFAEPLQVRYWLPLPADAAVAGFAFAIGGRRIVGQIDRRAAARERFERALVEGRTTALLEQERNALFNQELGNLPPQAEVSAEIELDQPLQWLDGQWEWRFPTSVAPRYGGDRAANGTHTAVPIEAAPTAKHLAVELEIAEALATFGAPSSPSHALSCKATASGTSVEITAAAMDRDVVVRWPVAATMIGATLQATRPSDADAGEAYGALTLVPPANDDRQPHFARDLIVLLDISGSMRGRPLQAAQRVASALIRSLERGDRLEMVAFAARPQAWLGAPCFATDGNKAAALRWLMGLEAGGGTEMHTAIHAALQPLRTGAQRQLVIVTDGLVGFESEIVAAIRTGLPASSRVHVVGVGSAPNRTLTRGASRAGRGLEVLIGLDEDPEPAAGRLLARTAQPLLTDLELHGTALLGVWPAAAPDLCAGAPTRIGLRLRPEGGTLVVRGATAAGPFVRELHVAPIELGVGPASVARFVGREQVEDLETELAARGDAVRLTASASPRKFRYTTHQ